MSLASVSRMEAKLLLPTYERQPILFVRGRGVYLWDSRGQRVVMAERIDSDSTQEIQETKAATGRREEVHAHA
jgi:hypothetical protein